MICLIHFYCFSWAIEERYGACLINEPEFVSDVVRQTRSQASPNLSVSVKCRIHEDIRSVFENSDIFPFFSIC